MRTTGNTILITGGGSGIGRALAQRFHDRGDIVIVAGRRAEALAETIAGRANMHALVLDVESPQAIRDFAAKAIAEFPAINVLINNAGIMASEDATAPRDLKTAEDTITTNLLGPIRLIDAFVDHLKGQADAAIVNVTSGLASVPLPSSPTYSATKAAVHSYTVSLRVQLAGKIEVIELAPPGVQTDLTPGQATREGYMPLEDYANEVMTLFAQVPTPSEVLVERVKPLRFAERDGSFDKVLAMLSGH